MEISDSNYPHTMAQAYADLAIQGSKDLLAAQKANAQRTSTGISDLRKALETFQAALDKFTGAGGGAVAHTASVSDTSLAKATAAAGAAPGSYTFFVEQLASNHQLASGALAA
ncbi:flagellar cap protein FliD N-terminal domain-containing protein, partial [Pseudoxanthomonas taiwanensis]